VVPARGRAYGKTVRFHRTGCFLAVPAWPRVHRCAGSGSGVRWGGSAEKVSLEKK
jgi:hypothetical protein